MCIRDSSYAGGPTERARLEDIRILHDITTDSTIKEPVVIYNIDEYKKTGNPKLNPLLYYADTIIVQGDAINLLEKTLQIAGSIATTILAAVSYTHLRAHETVLDLVCRLLLEKKKQIYKEV